MGRIQPQTTEAKEALKASLYPRTSLQIILSISSFLPLFSMVESNTLQDSNETRQQHVQRHSHIPLRPSIEDNRARQMRPSATARERWLRCDHAGYVFCEGAMSTGLFVATKLGGGRGLSALRCRCLWKHSGPEFPWSIICRVPD